MKSPVLFLVEDDESLNTIFTRILEKNGFTVLSFTDGMEALKSAGNIDYSIALLDVNLGNVSGFDILEAVKRFKPAVPTIMITAFSSVDGAVRAMKKGAYDYLTKPVKERELVLLLNNALKSAGIADNTNELSVPLTQAEAEFVGNSEAILRLKETIAAVAKKNIPVFITGETGTGKELIAHMLHNSGPNPSGPFVAINCAAVPEALFESELFGHEKGAFTGALKDRPGKLGKASGGTVFFDEITEMPIEMQTKLLRVIQEREFDPVGSDRTVKVNARFVAASNRDVKQEIAAGRFREDLWYRLNVYPVQIIPLRERKEDILLLINNIAQSAGYPDVGISPSALDNLLSYPWPGNVRELQNVIQFALISSGKSFIDISNLPDKISCDLKEESIQEKAENSVKENIKTLDEHDRTLILEALKKNGGNQTRTAKALGITRARLIYKMKRLNISFTIEYK